MKQSFAVYPLHNHVLDNPKIAIYADSNTFVGNEREIVSKKDKLNHKHFRANRKQGKRSWL